MNITEHSGDIFSLTYQIMKCIRNNKVLFIMYKQKKQLRF